MVPSKSKRRRMPYLGRLQVSSQIARENFYKPHPHREAARGKKLGPDSPFAVWSHLSILLEKRIQRRKDKVRRNVQWKRHRKELQRAKAAERRIERQFEQHLESSE